MLGALVATLAGCAGAPSRDMFVRVPAPKVAELAQVADRRPPAAREPRADAETAQYVYLGDARASRSS